MKKNYSVVFVMMVLLSFPSLKAQTADTSVATATNAIFAPLEKNRIPYNMLLDYGIELIDITKYDGVLRTDNYVNAGVYKDTYSTLVSTCTAANVPGIVAPMADELAAKADQKRKNKSAKGTTSANMLLNGLYYKYSRFRSDALSASKITVVNNTYDDKYISGVWQNPYETKTAFVISTPVLELNKGNISLSLPSFLWHTNQATGISNVEVDFGNGGGYKTLYNNAIAINTYAAIGTYTLTYRLKLTSGSYLYSRQKLKVKSISASTTAKGSLPIKIQPITSSRPYLNIAGSATLQIAYGSTDGKIRKPLIVAEGFDTGLLSSSGSIGDSDYFNFITAVGNAGIELQNLITNNTTVDYDVIYVNWDNGTDYIQRNAYVLEEVIKWVNTQKAAAGSTIPNVVLGQSMGGIIARYALKDMENRGEQHKTGLYISHDAPHQGANVPLGGLYMARHLINQVIKTPANNISIPITSSSTIGISDVTHILDAPATRQMLINNVSSSFAIDNVLRDSFKSELKTLGYPAQTRNIALSNASHCATPQGVTAGGNIFNLTANGRTTFLTDFILTLLPLDALASVVVTTLTNDGGFLIGALPGRSKLNIDFRVNAYPASGSSQIYFGRVRYTKKLLWLIDLNKDITSRQYNSPSGVLAIDSYPGGVIPSLSNVNISSFQSNAFVKYGYSLTINPNLNFIPATSALDVGKGNTVLAASDYTLKYSAAAPPTGSKAIPFVNFMTSYTTTGANEPHISFNARNGKWLASELDAVAGTDVYDCSYVCGTLSIAGGSSFCTTGTYSVPVSGGATVNWSISPSNAATFPSGSANSKTFTKRSTFNGSAIITAVITNPGSGCASRTVAKTVSFGGASGTLRVDDLGNGFVDALVTGISGPYKWYKNGTLIAGATLQYVTVNLGCYGGLLSVRGTNSCAAVEISQEVELDCNGSSALAVYPNPASSEIFIEKNSEVTAVDGRNNAFSFNAGSFPSKIPVNATLYDFSGHPVKELYFEDLNQRPRIDVSDLSKRTYILKIVAKDIDEVHQIIVE